MWTLSDAFSLNFSGQSAHSKISSDFDESVSGFFNALWDTWNNRGLARIIRNSFVWTIRFTEFKKCLPQISQVFVFGCDSTSRRAIFPSFVIRSVLALDKISAPKLVFKASHSMSSGVWDVLIALSLTPTISHSKIGDACGITILISVGEIDSTFEFRGVHLEKKNGGWIRIQHTIHFQIQD